MKADLLDHRKFLRLARLLAEPKAHVIGYLMLMWRRGYQTGNPFLGDELDVEAAAEYMGEPGKFATAAHSAGFIDELPDSNYQIHDLWDHAPEWAKKRMARNGFMPEGTETYAGITPKKKRRAADETPKQTPRGVEKGPETEKRHAKVRGQSTEVKGKSSKPSAEAGGGGSPRPRDELFNALVEVTGSSPITSGSHIGRVKKLLLAEDPPYTPEEVRRMADPDFLAREMNWGKGRKPTLGEVEKYIGRVRSPSAPPPPAPKSAAQKRSDAEDAYAAEVIRMAFEGQPKPKPDYFQLPPKETHES